MLRECMTPAPDAGQLEHLVVADGVDLAGFGHDARVGGVDAVHVGVDFAADLAPSPGPAVVLHDGGQGDGRGVGAAAAERGDVVVLVDALEAGDDDDLAVVEGLAHAVGGDVLDAGLGVGGVGDDADLGAGEADGLLAEGPWMAMAMRAMEICSPVERSMSISRAGGCSLISLGQLDEFVGGVAAGADDDDDLVAGLLGADGPAGGVHDAFRVGDAAAAELRHQFCRLAASPPARDASASRRVWLLTLL